MKMYGYYDEESRRNGCKKTAAAHRSAADLFPVIRKVFEQFDGKVYNCRFEKALQEAAPDNRVYVHKREYAIEVYTYQNDYRGDSIYMLAYVSTKDLKDGKRIPADKLIESARECRESHLKDAAVLDSAPETAPEMVKQINYFLNQANKIIESLPYDIQEMYHISRARMN